MTVTQRFIAGVLDPCGLRPGGTPEFGGWAGGNFHLESIRHVGFVAAQIQPQASLRDADHIYGKPGDKSPGYYRSSLRDEMKTGFQISKLQTQGLNLLSTLGNIPIIDVRLSAGRW
jgi:hypothetical protein